jgi:hypothetical protein
MSDSKIAYKGFNKDLTCRGFQFEIGKEYIHEGKVEACSSGFHSYEYPLDVFSYYNPADSIFAKVTASGEIKTHDGDSKIASAKLTVNAEIKLPELIQSAIAWIVGKTIKDDCVTASNTGYQSAASNTGYQSAASNTGDWSAASNTGYQSAASNTGDYSAASNTGYQSAASNTGDYSAASNTGNQSAASNTGDWSAASNTGKFGIAIASGKNGKAMACKGSAIVLCAYDDDGVMTHVKSAIAGKGKVKSDTWYTLSDDGKFVEVCIPETSGEDWNDKWLKSVTE